MCRGEDACGQYNMLYELIKLLLGCRDGINATDGRVTIARLRELYLVFSLISLISARRCRQYRIRQNTQMV